MDSPSRQHPRAPSALLRTALLWITVSFTAMVALNGAGCLERRDLPATSDVTRCATCHGDPARHGDYLLRAAPPHDLEGQTATSYPGVGAHQIHLAASATHAAIACDECHSIPKQTNSKGHADSRRPAELVFGALASTGERHPTYDAATETCGDTYCHRSANAVWTSPRSSDRACGSCHGLPPPAPHPQSERCSSCHGRVVDDARHIIDPALHVNGSVEYDPPSCTTCHGSGMDPAPPVDTHGNVATTFVGVGAHQAHLGPNVLGRPLACTECHTVPNKVDAPGHIIGMPAPVLLTSVGTSGGHDAAHFDPATRTCADTWCHGAGTTGHGASPDWTSSTTLGCDSCHANPPAAPHPQMKECSRCHSDIVGTDNVTIIDPTRHVDGHVDVAVPTSCTTCHGGANPAPPVDTNGDESTTASGVGAHQAHVVGAGWSRPVPCTECHIVPEHTLDPGHIDTPRPAEVHLTATAAAFGGTPTYTAGTCKDTSCHGAVFPSGDDSGGTNTVPTWTKVGGTEAACGSCHGLPPPRPHPVGSLNPVCSKCHEDIAPDNVTFVRPELHVDGKVTFTLP